MDQKKMLRVAAGLACVLFLAGCGNAAKTGSSSSAEKTKWPAQPVNMLVPASAGGATDLSVRLLADYITKKTGQAVVITNVTGLAGYEQVRAAKPNGYNYVVGITGLLISKAHGDLGYGYEAFDPVAMLSSDYSTGIVVRSNSPYQTIKALLDAAKANPRGVTGGISMTGYPYLFIEALKKAVGIDLYCVDAGNTASRNTALLGGQVDYIVTNAVAAKAYIASGDFKVLATGGTKRNFFLPDVPTFLESGCNFDFPGQGGFVLASKGTDPEIIKEFNRIIGEILEDKDYQAASLALNMEPSPARSVAETTDELAKATAVFMEFMK